MGQEAQSGVAEPGHEFKTDLGEPMFNLAAVVVDAQLGQFVQAHDAVAKQACDDVGGIRHAAAAVRRNAPGVMRVTGPAGTSFVASPSLYICVARGKVVSLRATLERTFRWPQRDKRLE